MIIIIRRDFLNFPGADILRIDPVISQICMVVRPDKTAVPDGWPYLVFTGAKIDRLERGPVAGIIIHFNNIGVECVVFPDDDIIRNPGVYLIAGCMADLRFSGR